MYIGPYLCRTPEVCFSTGGGVIQTVSCVKAECLDRHLHNQLSTSIVLQLCSWCSLVTFLSWLSPTQPALHIHCSSALFMLFFGHLLVLTVTYRTSYPHPLFFSSVYSVLWLPSCLDCHLHNQLSTSIVLQLCSWCSLVTFLSWQSPTQPALHIRCSSALFMVFFGHLLVLTVTYTTSSHIHCSSALFMLFFGYLLVLTVTYTTSSPHTLFFSSVHAVLWSPSCLDRHLHNQLSTSIVLQLCSWCSLVTFLLCILAV